MDSTTCKPPSSYAGTGTCQELVHADVRPWSMPWLGYLGKSSNEALPRVGHGLGA